MEKVYILFGEEACRLTEDILDVAAIDPEDFGEKDARCFSDEDLEVATPVIREFKTKEEAVAYILGIADMDGWLKWNGISEEEVQELEKGKERICDMKKEIAT